MFLLLFWTELLFIATILMVSRLTVHEMFCQILELQWQLGAWPCASFLISPPAKQNDLQEKQGLTNYTVPQFGCVPNTSVIF